MTAGFSVCILYFTSNISFLNTQHPVFASYQRVTLGRCVHAENARSPGPPPWCLLHAEFRVATCDWGTRFVLHWSCLFGAVLPGFAAKPELNSNRSTTVTAPRRWRRRAQRSHRFDFSVTSSSFCAPMGLYTGACSCALYRGRSRRVTRAARAEVRLPCECVRGIRCMTLNNQNAEGMHSCCRLHGPALHSPPGRLATAQCKATAQAGRCRRSFGQHDEQWMIRHQSGGGGASPQMHHKGAKQACVQKGGG